MTDRRVSIALCTWNGERFLAAQLDSLCQQTLVPYELIACDDGSSDSTLLILQDYATTAPFSITILRNTQHLGVIGNFARALGACSGEYIALCDQDDVWTPDKLERLTGRAIQLERSGCAAPYLVHSDLELADAELRGLGISYLEHQGLKLPESGQYRTLLVQNYIPGCSMLFSRDLLDLALPVPGEAVMHDWWLALLASAAGSLDFEPSRTVLYRQHSGNQLGSAPRLSRKTAGQVLAIKPALDVIRNNFRNTARQAIAAERRLRSCNIEIPEEFSAYVQALGASRLKTLKALLAGRIGRANRLRNLTLFLAVMLPDRKLTDG